MASIQQRGDKFLAQVRIKQGGVVIFSESKVFDTELLASTWGKNLEAKVKKEGPAKYASSKITVGELVDIRQRRRGPEKEEDRSARRIAVAPATAGDLRVHLRLRRSPC